jgi:hypothetical protein
MIDRPAFAAPFAQIRSSYDVNPPSVGRVGTSRELATQSSKISYHGRYRYRAFPASLSALLPARRTRWAFFCALCR